MAFMEFIKSDLFVRIVGFIGIVLTFIAFQSNKHKNIVLIKLTSEFIFGIQYLLVGAYTGCVLNVLGSVRNFTYLKLDEKGKSTRIAMLIFMAVFTVSAILTWDGWLSVFPLIGKLFSTAAYSMKNPRQIRFLNVPTAIMWVVYNVTFHMWEALFADSMSLVSVAIAIYRFDIKPCLAKKKETVKRSAS